MPEVVDSEIPAIHIANAKGGVGKTSLVVSIATEFACRGYRTLVVDLDAQAHTTKLLQPKLDEAAELRRWERYFSQLENGRDIRPFRSKVPHLSYLPGDYYLVNLEAALQGQRVMQRILNSNLIGDLMQTFRRFAKLADNQEGDLSQLLYNDLFGHVVGQRAINLREDIRSSRYIRHAFDIILYDTGPTASQLMVAALAAATHYLPITTPTELSVDGTSIYQNVVNLLKNQQSTDASCLGVLINQFRDNADCRNVVDYLRRVYGDLVIDQYITFDQRWDDAMSGDRMGGVSRYFRGKDTRPKVELQAVVDIIIDRLAASGFPLATVQGDQVAVATGEGV